MPERGLVMVALSGGVDSAVAALRLRDAGFPVQCVHMTNWEDDGYCDSAADFQDARKICRHLGLPLHRVSFAGQYKRAIFEQFVKDYAGGRTPNPDVLCNRRIKFGVLLDYARRLGAEQLATGHFARLKRTRGQVQLLKGRDLQKDQSYFLHAVRAHDLKHVIFPLGDMTKRQVRTIARNAGLAAVAEKKDSTGICFIGERPFAPFLSRYLTSQPGVIKDPDGRVVGTHQGAAYYTLGQRQGLGIGGLAGRSGAPWYVAAKDLARNELIAVQGKDHPLLFQNWLTADAPHWINGPPGVWHRGATFRCTAKTRYRQPDQPCTVRHADDEQLEVSFDSPQRAVTPGQYVVLYQGEHCLGGATIGRSAMRDETLASVV